MTWCTNNEEGRQEMTQENKQAASDNHVEMYNTIKAAFEKLIPRPGTCLASQSCPRPCVVSSVYVTFELSEDRDGLLSPLHAQSHWLSEFVRLVLKSGFKLRAQLSPAPVPVVSPINTSDEIDTTCKFSVSFCLSLYAGHHVVVDGVRIYREVVSLARLPLNHWTPESYLESLTRKVFEHRAKWPGVASLRLQACAEKIKDSNCYLEAQCLGGFDLRRPAPCPTMGGLLNP